MSQMYPVHIIQSDFFQIFSSTSFPATPKCCKCSLSLRFSHQNLVYTYFLSDASCTHHPSFPPWFECTSISQRYILSSSSLWIPPSPPISCCLSSPTIILSPCSQTHSVYGLPLMVHILLCDLITGEILHKTQLCYCMTLHNHIMSHSNKAVSNRTFTQLWSLLDVGDQVSRPHKTEGKIVASR